MVDISGKLNSILNKEPFSFIKKIKKSCPQAEIFLVGGTVRDFFLNKKDSEDYDFVVRGIKEEKLENMLAELGKVSLVGKRFGVVKFIPKNSSLNHEIDIALPRTEKTIKKTGAYRDFKISSSPHLRIEKDLARRDFTINAIAYNVSTRGLIDPCGGREDLKKKIIKTVGNPEDRFKEDYSRLLRAVRFSLQLGFKIEEKTKNSLVKLFKNLGSRDEKNDRIVPYEVIAGEFLKMLKQNTYRAFVKLEDIGFFKLFMPEIYKMKGCEQPDNWHAEGDVWRHTLLCVKNIDDPGFKKKFKNPEISPELSIALILHDIGKPYTIQTPEKDGTDRIRFNNHDQVGAKLAEEICVRLKLSSPPDIGIDVDQVIWLIKNHLINLHANMDEIKDTTVEKYFFKNPEWGENLILLIYLDTISSLSKDGGYNLSTFDAMTKRVNRLKKLQKNKTLPKPILNGNEIMKRFKLPSGPKIKKYKDLAREAQLKKKIASKKEAYNYLEKLIK